MAEYQSNTLLNNIRQLVVENDFEILGECVLPPREPRFDSVPEGLDQNIRSILKQRYPDGLYYHQSEGIRIALNGSDICLATSTASGKSLVFMTAAAQILQREPHASILALYPAKALIQDQLEKWNDLLRLLGLKADYVDGKVDVEKRLNILSRNPVVLMTPDVAHAWLLSHLQAREVRDFLLSLRLLVLDEAHVYDGVFGTNMAYFIRRLLAVSNIQQIISSTATIGSPEIFIERLTGRAPTVIDTKYDGSKNPVKTILVVRRGVDGSIDQLVKLTMNIANRVRHRFLAFSDSRKMVEQIVAIASRSNFKEFEVTDHDLELETGDSRIDVSAHELETSRVLPYRAGYEEEDRKAIQAALRKGELAGVVSTSALELGLDIGEIDIVLLLSTPPSIKALWQRLGRAGRKRDAICILVDDSGIISGSPNGIDDYLRREPEPGWLYLENQFIQYAHALCAATEADFLCNDVPFKSLPGDFLRLLENELNPTESVRSELYPLKQRAQAGPHYEFPLRSGVEKNFTVTSPSGPVEEKLGSLTYSQVLREAYPGAIYYYMARPYRVNRFDYRMGKIYVKREKHWTTQPLLQNMVFPKFPHGVRSLRRSDQGFLAEVDLQVSERVTGFIEKRGNNKIQHLYDQHSSYWQRPVTRFYETTGVCWYFADHQVITEAIAQYLLTVFCHECGIQERDLGIGTFHAKPSAIWTTQCQGVCIYDAIHGSLQLTKQLFDRFDEIVTRTLQVVELSEQENTPPTQTLQLLEKYVISTQLQNVNFDEFVVFSEQDWTEIIAAGEPAIYRTENLSEEVRVRDFRYTPQGPMYELEPRNPGSRWMVNAAHVVPINGLTRLIKMNLITGETKPISLEEVPPV